MSNTNDPSKAGVLPLDTAVGGDADQPGISQPVTQAEVDDILNDPDLLMEERQARLQELADRVGYRENVDRGEEFDPLEMQISEALNMLAQGGHTYGTLSGAGLDPENRADARAADEQPVEDEDGPRR
ncbi:hypothetical protein [Aurantimonas sp. VKM B-3413]|uniref:hypothetical protein n=1 Tax=Aurantimonas sp. VKM B-3413 TaxID=2779401 RepID=UPI001E433AE4|nr:hypothetical protein [Aurantimonas sp. VKM B-3413]MCB8838108.1 hypothetical protein [Aurantimonas sp. VKM B-3413]